MRCTICESPNVNLICRDHPGYSEEIRFDVFECLDCSSQFVRVEAEQKKVYEQIYSESNAGWYNRYYRYAKEVKSKDDPLRFLSSMESAYFPTYRYLKGKAGLKVLEVGCGYGYLSYSMKSKGFDVTAIDISEKAVGFARENFGDYFRNVSISDLDGAVSEKFDLIIATEVIEHLVDPSLFLKECLRLLKTGGSILITTPNRDYYSAASIWQTDLPPLHLTWISTKGMSALARKHGLEVHFTKFSGYYPRSENRLAKFLWSRRRTIMETQAIRNNPQDGSLVARMRSRIHGLISFLLHRVAPIRFASNMVYNLVSGKEMTLGAVLRVMKP